MKNVLEVPKELKVVEMKEESTLLRGGVAIGYCFLKMTTIGPESPQVFRKLKYYFTVFNLLLK